MLTTRCRTFDADKGVISMSILQAFMLALALASLSVAPAWAADPKPQGENCDHAIPPPKSGEDFANGILIRVFPRNSDIAPGYHGCQAVWHYQEKTGKWILVSLVEFKDGGPYRLWTQDKNKRDQLSCRYHRGETIKGDSKRCIGQGRLYTPSLPTGCLKKIESALTVVGPAAPRAMHECRME
jgi:hypothetical protein